MPTAPPTSKGAQALSDEQIEELKAFYGLDKPMLIAYWEWLQKLAVLDLGESTRYYEPVWDLIKERLPVTAFFGLATFLLLAWLDLRRALSLQERGR